MYQAPNKKFWKGRSDIESGIEGHRWHQIIKPLKLTQDVHISGQQQNIAFLGFCSDEGVFRNKGRVGAQQGPDALREAMANLPVHFDKEYTAIFDAGNVICPSHNMETAQQLLAQKIFHLLQHGFIPILLGGGHEISYGHYLGIHQYLKSHPEANFGVVNIDAHFNLKSYSRDPNNETAFRQIADLRRNHDKSFHYLCLGIQQISNTRAIYNSAKLYNTQYLSADEMRESMLPEVKELINKWLENKDWIYLSLDLDVMMAATSPGVSTPATLGIDPYVVKEILVHLLKSNKVLSIDVAELCPVNDQDNRTANLAAQLIFNMVQTISTQAKE